MTGLEAGSTPPAAAVAHYPEDDLPALVHAGVPGFRTRAEAAAPRARPSGNISNRRDARELGRRGRRAARLAVMHPVSNAPYAPRFADPEIAALFSTEATGAGFCDLTQPR